jgi:uncharacterized DUF497 family protein
VVPQRFRWNGWNIEHLAKHGVQTEEAEMVVNLAQQPYPTGQPDGKYLVIGRGRGGRFLQVIYILDEDRTVYVIHARPLTQREKQRFRRRIR